MKVVQFLSLCVCLLVFAPPAAASNERIGDFALLDHTGKFHQLSYYGDQRAIVIMAHQVGDPKLQPAIAGLQSMQQQLADQDVLFFLLNAALADDRAGIAAEAERQGIGIPILVDETQLVAESLGMSRIGEALVVDPRSMQAVHRGSLADDGTALRQAVDALLHAKPASASGPQASGRAIQFAARDAHRAQPVSYSRDVAPILERHCTNCHHEGGIGPWAMTDHAMVRGWSAMMREVVMARRMPPGQIDTHVSRSVDNAAGLSRKEMQQLIHWIDAGAPKDGSDDPLTALAFNHTKFSLGEPDLIYTVPAQSIPATGVIDYRYVPVNLNLDRDVWVRAMEFVPGDRKVLHHVIAYVSSPADKSVRGRETGAAQGESVGGFAPGRQPDEFRDNSGRLIRKGSNLLLQMHYTTSGKATVDETEIGIFLYDEPPAYVMSGGVAGQRRFLVPPHAKEYQLEGDQLIERDAYLYDLMPHMHYRGKYMNYSVEYPDGTSEMVLSVPKYDFNWQFNYRLSEPLFLPAGTRLIARGAMDNSARNPANPDPSKPVHFGLQTKHEMFFGFTNLRYVGDTPEKLAANRSEAPPEVGSE